MSKTIVDKLNLRKSKKAAVLHRPEGVDHLAELESYDTELQAAAAAGRQVRHDALHRAARLGVDRPEGRARLGRAAAFAAGSVFESGAEDGGEASDGDVPQGITAATALGMRIWRRRSVIPDGKERFFFSLPKKLPNRDQRHGEVKHRECVHRHIWLMLRSEQMRVDGAEH